MNRTIKRDVHAQFVYAGIIVFSCLDGRGGVPSVMHPVPPKVQMDATGLPLITQAVRHDRVPPCSAYSQNHGQTGNEIGDHASIERAVRYGRIAERSIKCRIVIMRSHCRYEIRNGHACSFRRVFCVAITTYLRREKTYRHPVLLGEPIQLFRNMLMVAR